MKRNAPRALGIAGAVLLAFSFFPMPAHAGDDGPVLDIGANSRRKVGRSGQVYCWKPDC